MAELVVKLIGTGNGVGNLFAQELAIAHPESMKRLFTAFSVIPNSSAISACEGCPGSPTSSTFSRSNNSLLPSARALVGETRQNLIEDRHRPPLFVNLVGCQAFHRLQIEPVLGKNFVE